MMKRLKRLKELKNWLKDCNYPDSVINKSFYNAKVEGPGPFTDNLKNIHFVTTYYENIDNEKVFRKIRKKLKRKNRYFYSCFLCDLSQTMKFLHGK